MAVLIELITSFPAVVFTALLAFCMAWWLIATIAGLDSEVDTDGALDDIGDALGISAVPPVIGLSILAFLGWVASIGITAATKAADIDGGALVVAAAGGVVLATVIAIALARPLAKRAAPLFVTELAPSEQQAIGAFARVRSPELDDDDIGPPGEVVVTSGALKGATFRAKAAPGHRYTTGDTVHIIDADHVNGRLVVTVDDVAPELAP
jgi:hypothetical protein